MSFYGGGLIVLQDSYKDRNNAVLKKDSRLDITVVFPLSFRFVGDF